MQAVDAVWLKTLILLSRNDPVITFEQILFLGNNPLSKANPILCLLKELGLLYVGRVMDIFLADKLKVKAEHLENNKLEFVGKYMTKEGGCVGYNEMIEFGKSFMSDCEESIKSSLKPYCEFRKDKKQFLLKTEYKDDIAINLKDFRTGIVPSKEDLPPLHTAQFVTGELLIVFRKIWTEETLKKLINILQVLAREHELMPTNYTALSNDLAKLGIMLE